MARRRTARRFPLEWKTRTLISGATPANEIYEAEFDLDLLPDEIAEIKGIYSQIAFNPGLTSTGDTIATAYLSMDPDADDDPDAESGSASAPVGKTMDALEDLETFFTHRLSIGASVTTSGANAIQSTTYRWLWFHDPILIGTNFNYVFTVNANAPATSIITVYFKRRSASAQELNQILLKRR